MLLYYYIWKIIYHHENMYIYIQKKWNSFYQWTTKRFPKRLETHFIIIATSALSFPQNYLGALIFIWTNHFYQSNNSWIPFFASKLKKLYVTYITNIPPFILIRSSIPNSSSPALRDLLRASAVFWNQHIYQLVLYLGMIVEFKS